MDSFYNRPVDVPHELLVRAKNAAEYLRPWCGRGVHRHDASVDFEKVYAVANELALYLDAAPQAAPSPDRALSGHIIMLQSAVRAFEGLEPSNYSMATDKVVNLFSALSRICNATVHARLHVAPLKPLRG